MQAVHVAAEGGVRIEYELRQTAKRLAGDAKTDFLDAAGHYLQARSEMFIFRQPPAEDEAQADDEAIPATAGTP